MNTKFLLRLIRHLKVKTFEKGEILINSESRREDFFFIRKGLVRSYHFNEKAEEITFQLFSESNFFGNAHAIFLNKPSKFTYEAIERTKVYTLYFDDFRKILAGNAESIDFEKSFIFRSTMSQILNRMESFVLLTPEERYKKYLQDHSKIIHRVPDKYIASVLGITPVSLSRIRGRLAAKN